MIASIRHREKIAMNCAAAGMLAEGKHLARTAQKDPERC